MYNIDGSPTALGRGPCLGDGIYNPFVDWEKPVYDRGYRESLQSTLPLETLTGPFASFVMAGQKLWGANIVPRPTDTGNYAAVTPSNMYDLCYDVCVDGATGAAWSWVKAQIDAFYAAGGRVMRWYWDATILVGDATHHGTATWRGTVTPTQFNNGIALYHNYLASKRMWSYPTCMEAAQADTAEADGSAWGHAGAGGLRLELPEVLSFIDSSVRQLILYPNVIAIDTLMEWIRSDLAMTTGNLGAIMNTARTARGTSKIPLTASLWDNQSPAIIQTVMAIAASVGVDFFDWHMYERGRTALFIEGLVNNQWGLPIMFGESGIPRSGEYFTGGSTIDETTHPFSSERVYEQFEDIEAGFLGHYGVQYLTFYGATDQHLTDPAQQWGSFDQHRDLLGNFDIPRPRQLGPMQAGPTAVEAFDRARVLDLSQTRPTPAAFSENKSYAVGWAMYDFSGAGRIFSVSGGKLLRAHSATVFAGLLDYFSPLSMRQAITLRFAASDATPSSPYGTVKITDSATGSNANPIGGNWTTMGGEADMQRLGNTFTPSVTGADCAARNTSVSVGANQYAQAKVTVTGTAGAGSGIGVGLRMSSGARTYYRLVIDHAASNNVELCKFVAGTFTSIWIRTSGTWSNGAMLRLEAEGTTLRAYLDGIQIGANVTDASIASGDTGIAYSSAETSASLINFESGEIGDYVTWVAAARIRPLDGLRYYRASLTAKPGDLSVDGILSIYAMNTAAALVAQMKVTTGNALLDLTHTYDLRFEVGPENYPTKLVAKVTDVTAATLLATLNASDSAADLQGAGVVGIPCDRGAVKFSIVTMEDSGNPGPTISSPPVFSAWTTSSVTMTWGAATGGQAPYRYIPQWVTIDSNDFPLTEWQSCPEQSGLSVVISGLSAGTRMRGRVQVIDMSMETP